MTRDEQETFVKSLMSAMTQKLIENSDKWSEDWDGIELRMLMQKAMEVETAFLKRTYDGRTKRAKDFKNTWLIENLY